MPEITQNVLYWTAVGFGVWYAFILIQMHASLYKLRQAIINKDFSKKPEYYWNMWDEEVKAIY
jgi:hypothetical protein